MKLGFTGRLAQTSARRPWRVIAAWGLLLAVALALAGSLQDHVTPEPRNLVATEADIAAALDHAYRVAPDGVEQYSETVIVTSDAFLYGSPEFDSAIDATATALWGVDGVTSVTLPDPATFGVSESGRSVLVAFTTEPDVEVIRDVMTTVDSLAIDGVDLLVFGEKSNFEAFSQLANEQLARGESIGIVAALVILVLVFGAFVAAALPLGIAIASIVTALGCASVIARIWVLSDGVLIMASMFGLALGIDYSLITVQRFREELAAGRDVTDAVVVAGSTANRAVLLSGTTVMVSLGGLFLIPANMTVGMALGAILVAFSSVAAALTLLPALLRLVGTRINKGRVPTAHPGHEPRGWLRFARFVVARPGMAAAVGLGVLAFLTIPLASIRLSNPGPDSYPEGFVTREANAILISDFGFGESTTTVAIENADGAFAEVRALADAMDADPAYANVTVDFRGDVAFVDARDTYSPADRRAEVALDRLRHELIPGALGSSGAVAYVDGYQATLTDDIGLFTSRAWAVVATVLGASFLILLAMFRSIVIPLKAILLNLLGTGAAFGALVVAYQFGWGSSLLGLPRVDGITPYLPLIVFALLFGLSMDYHVFLLSRIKEKHDAGATDREAIVHGLGYTGRLITGAAIIMVAVFAGFAAADVPELSQWGFGLAAAVIVDATVVRVLLVPAFMTWLGAANWYLPRWLRWIPTARFETAEIPPASTTEPAREPALA